MKRMCLLIVVAPLVLRGEIFAHGQHVHQYVVKEAYQLLRTQLGYDVPGMVNHVGGLEPFYAGDYAWQRPYLTTGAWREDDEDPVFGYRLSNLLNNYSLVSISHFWDADQGDLNTNLFRVNPLPFVVFDIGPYENSYDKLLRYANGGWILWFPDTIIVQQTSNGHFLALMPFAAPPPAPSGVPMQYPSLTSFYQSRTLTLRSDVSGGYVILDLNDQAILPPGTPQVEVLVDTDVRDRIVWEVLGRMCHLVADLSVPAHSRRDEHGLDLDSYEQWMGGTGSPYTVWNAANAGSWINPYTPDDDPLHYLMYTMHQQANHFGSNGPYEGVGNDLLGGAARPQESAFLTALNLPSFGPPTDPQGPWTVSSLENIRDETFPYTIRTTAGLLYWFAREAHLVTSVELRQEALPVSFMLAQNYPNPFNPTTVVRYQLPVVSEVKLVVYDILGKEVATLVDGVEEPGYRSVEWDASGVPSGAYFCRLHAGMFVDTKKLLLIR